MSLYVFIVDKCESDAQRHGHTSLIMSIKLEVEKTQTLTGFRFFHPTAFVVKNLGRSFRLIGYRTSVGDDELILFVRVFSRGGKEYHAFLEDYDKSTDRFTRQLQPYTEGELKQIHAHLSSGNPIKPPPVLDDEERAWLFEVFRQETPADELIVLETEAWVKNMRSPQMRDFLALYHQVLEGIDPNKLQPAASNSECNVYWEKNRRVGIAYLYRPDVRRFILLAPLRQSDFHNENAILLTHREKLSRIGSGANDLSRAAARAYPYLMILDQTAWLAIQKNEEANLALSPEEAELLESIRRAGAVGEYGYPLFINGRAGSGKSTMLQYLAADYIDFSLSRSTRIHPVYMTCSRELLERARETVHGLLTGHHERLLDGVHMSDDIERILKNSFVVFHDYLKSLLPPEDKEALTEDCYVNFAKFRQLWIAKFAQRPEAKRINLEVAWHTIRSYIKGIRSSQNDDLDPEEFAELPRRRRSVSDETYRLIYDRVWCSWYKPLCEAEGYWDDQDLAARVLKAGSAREIDLAAIFCDEAQDFTPIELEIIFQLLVFSKRSLQPEELQRVPIVFAGDPLQTINPTGFRWESVQADFHDRFNAVLVPRRRARVDINYKELRFNYRSNLGIVRFCNLIQLVRAVLLGSQDINPQQAWWVEEPAHNVWFAVDNAATKQQIQLRPELVKLINCDEGQESEFALADSILKDLKEESDGVYRNVLGPTRAKGLEFPTVILHKFSETAPPGFLDLLAGTIDVKDDPERRLPFEYFFNRLYVAASRAKGQLIVVDSADAFDDFWRFATDPDFIDQLMEKISNPNSWKESINYLVRGREETWSGERINQREQASEYATQGKRKRDPYLLRQAALAYKSAIDELEAGRCLALALEFEEKLKDAGNRYQTLALHDEAFRCYWTGRHFANLCNLAAEVPIFASRLETRAADFMANNTGAQGTFISEVVRAVLGDPTWRNGIVIDPTWRFVFTKLAEQLVKVVGQESVSVSWSELFAMFSLLYQEGVAIDEQHLAQIAYRASELKHAIAIWERIGNLDREEYKRAKANLVAFPENIVWLSRLREHEEVLSQWRTQRANLPNIANIPEAVRIAVVDAAIEEGELHLAVELLEEKPDKARVVKLLEEAAKRHDTANALAGARMGIRWMVAKGYWKAVIQVVEKYDFSELFNPEGLEVDQKTSLLRVDDQSKRKLEKELKTLLRGGDGAATIVSVAIEELAESNLDQANGEDKEQVSRFLNRTFIGKDISGILQQGIKLEAVGAAIERAGKIIDAIQFYEPLSQNKALSIDIRRFAVQRLVRNLERYAEYFRGKGEDRQALRREGEAKRIREQTKLGDRQLPDYPAIPKRVAQVEPSEWSRPPLKYVLSRPLNRLRIEHTERFETITIKANERRLSGDPGIENVGSTGETVTTWRISEWEMTLQLNSEGTKHVVSTIFEGDRFDVEWNRSNETNNSI